MCGGTRQWPQQSRPVRRHPSCAGLHARGTLCAREHSDSTSHNPPAEPSGRWAVVLVQPGLGRNLENTMDYSPRVQVVVFRPLDVGPPQCPTRSLPAALLATAMRTRTRSSCGRAGRGLGRAPRQPQMQMINMVAIPPHSASCRPHHRVTERKVRGARGSVRGVWSVSHAWSCQSVQSLPGPYPSVTVICLTSAYPS